MKHKSFIDRQLERLGARLARLPLFAEAHKWKITGLFLLFTLALAPGAERMKLDQSMEAFFLEQNQALQQYRHFRHIFGSDEVMVIMYEPPSGDVFAPQSLKKVKALEDYLKQKSSQVDHPLNRITRIRSIVSADYLETKGNTLVNRPFIGDDFPQSKKEVERLRQKALEHNEYPGTYFSEDSRLGMIVIETDFGARQKQKPPKKQGDSNDSQTKKDSSAGEEFDFSVQDPNQAQPNKNSPKESPTKDIQKEKSVAANSGSEEFDFSASKDPMDKTPLLETPQMEEYSRFSEAVTRALQHKGWANPSAGEEPSPKMNYTMAGNPWLMDFFAKVIMKEMEVITAVSILIIILVLLIAFRSIAAPVWPSVIVLLSIIWTLGLVGWLRIEMSMMVNIVIFLNLTVGIAASIHILSGFRYFQNHGYSKEKALSAAYGKSGVAILLAGLTTITGLLSLVVVPIVPIKIFSVTAGIGILFTLVGSLLLLPVLLVFWSPNLKTKHTTPQKGKATESSGDNAPSKGSQGRNIENFFQRLLEGIHETATHRAKTVIGISALILLVSAMGYPRVYIDTNIVELVKPGYGIREAYRIIDKHFGGINSVEIIINAHKQDAFKDPALVNAVDDFAREVLREHKDFVARVHGLNKVAKESYKALTSGQDKDYRIPQSKPKLAQTLLSFESADPQTRRLVVDDDWSLSRISLQVYTKSSYKYEDFAQAIRQKLHKHFESLKDQYPQLESSITGNILLMMQMANFISEAQIQSFGLVLLVVTVILLLLYGSVRFGLMAMIPNLLPVAMVLGVLGWFKIPLDSDTVLVLPIAIGIAVDDTIHFLTHYKNELLQGYGRSEALRLALKEVGQAIIFTSVVLSLGFLVFLSSAYLPLVNFGILSAVAIFTALLADLFLMPALIVTFKPLHIKE